MEEKAQYTDLLYFGYDYIGEEGEESKKFQSDFILEIKEKFPSVKLQDAYNEIKGYRQEVYLPKEQRDDFFAYLVAYGWYEFSLTLEMLKLSSAEDSESKKLFMYYIDKAKEQYPNNFKQQ